MNADGQVRLGGAPVLRLLGPPGGRRGAGGVVRALVGARARVEKNALAPLVGLGRAWFAAERDLAAALLESVEVARARPGPGPAGGDLAEAAWAATRRAVEAGDVAWVAAALDSGLATGDAGRALELAAALDRVAIAALLVARLSPEELCGARSRWGQPQPATPICPAIPISPAVAALLGAAQS